MDKKLKVIKIRSCIECPHLEEFGEFDRTLSDKACRLSKRYIEVIECDSNFPRWCELKDYKEVE